MFFVYPSRSRLWAVSWQAPFGHASASRPGTAYYQDASNVWAYCVIENQVLTLPKVGLVRGFGVLSLARSQRGADRHEINSNMGDETKGAPLAQVCRTYL